METRKAISPSAHTTTVIQNRAQNALGGRLPPSGAFLASRSAKSNEARRPSAPTTSRAMTRLVSFALVASASERTVGQLRSVDAFPVRSGPTASLQARIAVL